MAGDNSYLSAQPDQGCTVEPQAQSVLASPEPQTVQLENVSIIAYAQPMDPDESIIKEGKPFGIMNAISSITTTNNIPLYLEVRHPDSLIILSTTVPNRAITGSWEISQGAEIFQGSIDYTSGAYQGLNVIVTADHFAQYPIVVLAADQDANGDGSVNREDAELVDSYYAQVGSTFDVETEVQTSQDTYQIGDTVDIIFVTTNNEGHGAPINELVTIPPQFVVQEYRVPQGELYGLPIDECHLAYYHERLEPGASITFGMTGVMTDTGQFVFGVRFDVPTFHFEDTDLGNNEAHQRITSTLRSIYLPVVSAEE